MLRRTRCIAARPPPQARRRYSASAAPATPTHLGKFDVCVVGCGPAGFAAATRAADLKRRVCIVEKGRIGGVGLHDGALASKTMWEIAENFKVARKHNRGYHAWNLQIDWDEIKMRIQEAVNRAEHHMITQLDGLGIPVFTGIGKFEDKNKVRIERLYNDVNNVGIVEADNFVVATGSAPRALDSIPVDREVIMNSDHILHLKALPKSLVVLGAGVVGCEYATMFANLRHTKVYVIDKADRILPFEDEDIARIVANKLQKKGVTIHHGAKLVSMKKLEGEVEYVLEYPKQGNRRETLRVEKALLSVGRVPYLDGLNIEAAGVKVKNGIVDDDDGLAAPNIWAVGDVTVDMALVNIAELEGRHAVERMFGRSTNRISYQNVSSIMFLDPKIAGVGLNETELAKRKMPYRVAMYSFGLVAAALAKGKTNGFVKLLVSNDSQMRLLGIRCGGVQAESLIEICSYLIRSGRSVGELKDLLTAYPAVSEALQEAVRLLYGESIYKPSIFPDMIRFESVTWDAQSGFPVRQSLL